VITAAKRVGFWVLLLAQALSSTPGLDCLVLLDIHHNDGTNCAPGEKMHAVARQVSVSADTVVLKCELFLKLASALQRKIHSSPLHFLEAHLAVLGVK
jgi:hypothetical protein